MGGRGYNWGGRGGLLQIGERWPINGGKKRPVKGGKGGL